MCHDAGITHGHAPIMMLPAARGDDSREEQIADVQGARGALFEHAESAAGENVFDVERSPGEDSLDREETCGTLAGLCDEFTVQLGSGLDLVVEEVQGKRFGWPPVWQRVFGGIRYEIEHKEWIEGGSKLLAVLDVIRHVVPQKELVPGFVEEFASELSSGVGEQSRHESTLGGTKPNPQVVFDSLDTKAAVLELPAATAGTSNVATDLCHRRSLRCRCDAGACSLGRCARPPRSANPTPVARFGFARHQRATQSPMPGPGMLAGEVPRIESRLGNDSGMIRRK